MFPFILVHQSRCGLYFHRLRDEQTQITNRVQILVHYQRRQRLWQRGSGECAALAALAGSAPARYPVGAAGQSKLRRARYVFAFIFICFISYTIRLVSATVIHSHPALLTFICPLLTRTYPDYNKRHESELVDRCKGIHGMLNYNLLSYTVQPIPFLGRVDLAAVFLHRRKFAAENLLFGK